MQMVTKKKNEEKERKREREREREGDSIRRSIGAGFEAVSSYFATDEYARGPI